MILNIIYYIKHIYSVMHQCHKKRGNTFSRTCKNPPSICPTSIPGFRLLPTSMTISVLKTFNNNNSLEFTQNQGTHKLTLEFTQNQDTHKLTL